MSDLEKNKAPEGENKEKKATEKVKDTVSDALFQELSDEDKKRMKDRYGDTKDSFIKGMRSSDEYGSKVKTMTDNEVIDFAKKEWSLRKHWDLYIEKAKSENPSPYLDNKQNGSFDQKIYTKIQKEQWTPAAFNYAARAKNNPKWSLENRKKSWEEKQKTTKKPDEKKEAPKEEARKIDDKPIEKLEEPKKEPEKAPEKKPDEKKETPKAEVKKTEEKPIEKLEEPKKEPEKAPEKKPDDKPKEEKKEKKGGKWFWKTTGDVVTYLPKQAWKGTKVVGKWIWDATKRTTHQTKNLITYPLRTTRSTVKFGRQYMDHGFSKAWREKNKWEYFSKWKWEQAGKKK